jgi:hypothetical protein
MPRLSVSRKGNQPYSSRMVQKVFLEEEFDEADEEFEEIERRGRI